MTPEQKQRIEQIKSVQQKRVATNQDDTDFYWDIDFFLSLVKNQEADGGTTRMIAEQITADLGYQGGWQAQQQLTSAIETALNNFAACMRSACVEKVRALQAKYKAGFGCVSNSASACDEIITALESVSIQEQER